jgi:exopolysaccharide production protein ExoZ
MQTPKHVLEAATSAVSPAGPPAARRRRAPDTARPRTTRYDGVQVLRLVAAVLVVITHATFYTHERLSPGQTVWQAGTAGVDIFFVISGFVIVVASRGLAPGVGGAKEFTIRRLIRIVPLYWIATTLNLAILFIAPGEVLHSTVNWWNIICSYVFVPSHNSDGRIEPLLGVGWTLTFEMFFYAVMALAILVRRNIYVFVGAVMLLCTLGSLWRQPDWPTVSYYLSPRVLEFYLGMLVALGSRHWRLSPWVAVPGCVLSLGLLVAGPWVMPALPLIVDRGLPSVVLVACVVALEPAIGARCPRFLVFLGGASYAIYLFHPLVAPGVPVVLGRLRFDNAPVSVVLSVVVAIAVASGLHVVVERPLTEWMNGRRRSARPAAP